jgi:CheY-like chemotaxis protein
MKVPEDRSLPVVLYVDDDAEDRMLMGDAIQMVDPRYQLVGVNDGNQAFRYLNHCRSSLPGLIILDLNLPGMDGIGIIDKLQQDKVFGSIPIVVFTTSASPTDQNTCARYRVDMITKPISFSVLTDTVKKLLSYCKES